jgi:Aminoglycoside-2''-adenylyltransferase
MAGSDLGPWEPLGLEAVFRIFAPAPFHWWISGGHALDLHLERTWRPHADTDVGVLRQDLETVHAFLGGWDLHVAAAGQLTPWRGAPLHAAAHQNNVWCRLTPEGPWVLDLTVGEGSEENWVYRRDPTVQVPWSTAVLRSTEGVPYLAPELQLLFKGKDLRPKEEVDAAEVIPSLDARQRDLLSRLLEPGHPWQRRLT